MKHAWAHGPDDALIGPLFGLATSVSLIGYTLAAFASVRLDRLRLADLVTDEDRFAAL